ncbi:hypothetical protein HBA94_17735, partial [Ochrobactrum sp. GRS2]|nr:hypothetical protein [Ochrobactrum sp. GRS2]
YTKSAGSQYKTPIKINTTAIKATHDGQGAGAPVTNEATITSKNEDPDYIGNNTTDDGGASIVDPAIDLKAHKSGPEHGLLIVG